MKKYYIVKSEFEKLEDVFECNAFNSVVYSTKRQARAELKFIRRMTKDDEESEKFELVQITFEKLKE